MPPEPTLSPRIAVYDVTQFEGSICIHPKADSCLRRQLLPVEAYPLVLSDRAWHWSPPARTLVRELVAVTSPGLMTHGRCHRILRRTSGFATGQRRTTGQTPNR